MSFLIVIIGLALVFDYINGFHDAANSIATIVSTKVLTPFQAVLWAALFNSVAFFIFKDHGVADTVSKTVDSSKIDNATMMMVIFAGLIAAICWNLFTWWFGIPSSSSHTLIGGFAGAGIAAGGLSAIQSEPILRTAAFIVLAPLIGGLIAFMISIWFLISFRKDIWPKIVSTLVIGFVFILLYCQLQTKPSDLAGLKLAENASSICATHVTNGSTAEKMGFKKDDIIVEIQTAKVSTKKELDEILNKLKPNEEVSFTVQRKNVAEHISTTYATSFDSVIARIIFFGSNFKWVLLSIVLLTLAAITFILNRLNAARANTLFKRVQLLSSATFSIGHGGNDAQKVMGIIAAALMASGHMDSFAHMPAWVPIACYSAIGLGTLSGGWKIVKTMGTKITKVTPFEGVAAETAGSITLFVTEALKIPVSTTHTITGSIMGVGATKRLSAVRWGVTINLLWAWILTIPISALLAAGVYYLVKLFM